MQRIIAGGTGFIGQYLVNRWLNQGISLTVIGRSAEKIKKQYADKVDALSWDELSEQTLDTLESAQAIINLTGAGIAEKRWSQNRKQELIYSRVQSTQQLAKLCSRLGSKSPPLLNANGVGIYGLQKGIPEGMPPPFDENTDLAPNQQTDFLADLGRQWEAALKPATNAGVRTVAMRFGVVLGPNGGALKQMALPFYFYLGGPVGSGQQPLSWIALPDLADAIEFLIEHSEIAGAINLVAPETVTQKQFAKTLGNVLDKPSFMPMPGFVLKLMLGEMADVLLLNGQNVYPKRLLEAGFTFSYPDLRSALGFCFR